MRGAGAEYVDAIDAEYEPDTGFLGQLRHRGRLDEAAFDRLIALLRGIEIRDAQILDRRFVELTWMMAMIVRWQAERLESEGHAQAQYLYDAADAIDGALQGILGYA